MEGTIHTGCFLSYTLGRVPFYRCFVDGLGDAAVDGTDTSLRTEQTQTVSIVDRRRIDWAGYCAFGDSIFCWHKHPVDRTAYRGLGRGVAIEPEVTGYETPGIVLHWNGDVH